MADFVRTQRADGTPELVPTARIGLLAAPVIMTVAATSYTLSDDHHGMILNFTSGSAVTVTVPAGLPADFICGINQGGAGQVTLSASGTTIHETDGLFATAGAHVLLTLMAFSADVFTLYGKTA